MNRKLWVRSAAWLCFAALWVLSACGGGGGSASPGAPAAAGPYAVGGTVSGLAAGSAVSLLNNGADPVALSANGAFTFASRLTAGSAYAVTVQSHTPGVACTVSNGSGTVGSAAVTGIAVSCAPGTASVLYPFDGNTNDGQTPVAGLVMDSVGNLYGTTEAGGDYGLGTVFKITPSGKYSNLYVFGSTQGDGQLPFASLTIDTAGNLYGTTYSGGTNGYGTIFKISTTGTTTSFTVLHTFGTNAAGGNDPSDGRNPQASLILDGAGNLYGTTYYGGTIVGACPSGCGTVFKVPKQSGSYSVLYRFAGVDGQNPQSPLVLDPVDNFLYGTTSAGGTDPQGIVLGTIFKLTTSGTNASVMHTFTGADGQTPLAGLVLDNAGYLWGTTSAGGINQFGTVFKIAKADNSFYPLYSFAGSDGKYSETGLVKDSADNFYGVAKNGGNTACADGCGTVYKITSSGTFSVLYSFGANDGQNPSAVLVLDAIGNLYGTTTVGPPTVLDPSGAGWGTVFKID